MYKSLNEIGSVHASTDDIKYSCSSLSQEQNSQMPSAEGFKCLTVASPNSGKFNPYYPNAPIQWYNRECYQSPELPFDKNPFFPSVSNEIPQVVQSYVPGGPHLPPPLTPEDPNSTNFYARELYNKPQNSCMLPNKNSVGNYPTMVPSKPPSQQITPLSNISKSSNAQKTPISPIPGENEFLLPVLDCRFNLREICKQCILLEDHLSHDKKRCYDCCIKHFLAIEGLSEEAVTLDKTASYKGLLKQIPDKVRGIQKFWYENPEKNSHEASQMLRELRKDFQQKVFNIGFETNSSSSGSCDGGTCKIKQSL
jgi:hypothetical protein